MSVDDFDTGLGESMLDVRRQRQPIALSRGLDGLPRAGAAGLIKPGQFNIYESTSRWVERTFSRPCYVWCPSAVRTLRYVPDFLPMDGATLIAQSLFFSSITGLVRIPCAGKWFFNIPIVVAEGTPVIFNYADALGDVGVDSANIIGASAPGTLAVPDPAVWVEAASLAVGVASVLVYAASATRRGLSVVNTSPGANVITLSVANPAVAGVGFLSLRPGIGYIFGPTDKCTQQQVYAISDLAAGTLQRAIC